MRQLTSCIHDGAAAQLQAVGPQQLADFCEDGCAQVVFLQQVAKVQKCGGGEAGAGGQSPRQQDSALSGGMPEVGGVVHDLRR